MFLTVITLVACSTQKNTWATRTYHTTTTRYNVYFNGYETYKEGLKNIAQANKDDYSTILPMYPISHHEAASAGASQMEKAIEKSRKCIKLHSIKKKPKPDYKKMRDPKYKAFYDQEEFNSCMDEAWLLLAKAEFHKGDFLGAIGTFNYIAKHYTYDKDIVAQCQLWAARAYGEMGWLYEAEEVLQKVNQDELKRSNAALYASVTADLMLKKKQYKEAIPFLQIAIQNEKKKDNRPRFEFILGQLYQFVGNKKAAEEAYTRVIKSNQPLEMDFNARINRTQLSTNSAAAIKSLKKMAKDYKYKDNLDQIYGTIGNIYLAKADTAQALENYQSAVKKSTQNALPKAAVLIKMGDIYYNSRKYVQAQPCYDEASKIISAESEDYQRVSKYSETLGELIVEYNTVQLQDSLQYLSTLSEKEQLAIITKMIADMEAAEKAAAEAAEKAAREQEEGGLVSVNTAHMIGGGTGTADWYFYNTNLINSGKQDFIRKWGNRKLEDNWRRASKSISAPFDDFAQNNEEVTENDSTLTQQNKTLTDTKNPAFYLQQIPKTEEQLKASDEAIATALYNMGFIYKNKVGDIELATETFDEFESRFPNDSRLVDVYYERYLTALKMSDKTAAEQLRVALINKFPDSKQAQVLSQSDYAERILQMNAQQDSLYRQTYQAYSNSQYNTVFDNKNYAEQHFSLSPLMPKFLFLNALAIAKTQDKMAFGDALREMIMRYPESDVSAMAKDMLAMMNQGMESQTGESHGSLIARRAEENAAALENEISEKSFSVEKNVRTLVFLVIDEDAEKLNNLLYQVALFNFSQFLIKDFDLATIPLFTNSKSALKISNLENYEESKWYCDLLVKNAEVNQLLTELQVQLICISEENFELITTVFTWDDYKKFQSENGLE